ncbi:MAG: Ig-like domain-containing protein [Candidatus Zixiibacteriota bacterium]
MQPLSYTPDVDLKVHEENAIRLICKAFQSHENGLPEWLKNSADAYAREPAPEAKRVIVVIFNFGRRDPSPSISCLDFSGMSCDMIEKDFRVWADPESARRSGPKGNIQGGHGNGGKCYMTQMFEHYAVIQSVKENRRNCYGVTAGSVRFGYVPDRETGRNITIASLPAELDLVLSPLGCSLRTLPKPALDALGLADGFTLIRGVAPKGYEGRIPTEQLIETLRNHPQMIRTLQLCKVFAVVNGVVVEGGRPLSLPDIPPLPGAEAPRVIAIPEMLKEELSGTRVSTTSGGQLHQGRLVLRTSEKSMRWSKKGRHSIIYEAQSGFIGYVSVPELDIQSSYRDHIYGECVLEALESFKQNDRARLADSPLSRAVERFVSEQIQAYAKEFEARDRRRYDQEEKSALSKMNEALDRWKNRLLNELLRGHWGPGDGGPPPPPPPLPSGAPARIEVSLSHQMAGLGVALRPTIRFFDRNGVRIRPVPFRWVSDDTNVAMVDEDLMIINTFSYGATSIYAEILNSRLCSNKVPLEVVRIIGVQIVPEAVEIPAGSRQKLEAVCRLANGQETSSVHLVWTENNPNVARVSSSGLVYGFATGETEVVAGDDSCTALNPAVVRVIPGRGKGPGDQQGEGYPTVKISEVDPDPDTAEPVVFSHDDPPVWQRPQDVDRNIWWINSAAPFARMYLDQGRGYGYDSREWRIYHLERYIDIMIQIALTQSPTEKESLSVEDWILRWGEQASEIQATAASALVDFIATGALPGE